MILKNLILPTKPSFRETGLGIVRIFLGVFMIYHGWEIFDRTKIDEYTKWMVDMKLFAPSAWAYLGKGTEFVAGIFILFGLFTRIAIIPLGLTMIFICFAIGKGRIFMEEQYPFLFFLLCFMFFFTGPGKWSIDKLLFRDNTRR